MSEYRVCHDREINETMWREGYPEVFTLANSATQLTKEWQLLIMVMNPGLSPKGFRALFNWCRALSNGPAGFDFPGGSPRADFINGRDENAKLPRLDKVRVCGGAILHGTQIGNVLIVQTLNGRKAPPSVDYIMSRPWLYFEAITVRSDGSNGRFPQNGGRPIYIPLVASGVVIVRINTKKVGKPYPYIVGVRDGNADS